jgi:hypothetical protein
MHSVKTINAALALANEGANACEVARRLGIPRTTARDWLRGRLPNHVALSNSGVDMCHGCGRVAHVYADLPEAYVYLLGLYLGDGCISRHRRGVHRLRVYLDVKYPGIIDSALDAMRRVKGGGAGVVVRPQNCVEVYAFWKSWPCLFPQHGPGRKHERDIALTEWQEALVDRWPDQLLRGLINSDGCRFQNTGTNWSWPRYGFRQVSGDIRSIFCRACDRLGVHWTQAGDTVYVSRKSRCRAAG